MLVNTKEMLENANKNGYAVPHFNINNLEWTRYILEECERRKSPVILGVSEGAIRYMAGEVTIANMVNGLISDLGIKIPVALHLDHGSSYESCKRCIDAGFTSVMIDASKYSLEENIKITKSVVEYAHSKNVTAEAEVGHVGGVEDDVEAELAYAKTEDAEIFVKETNVDSLAPAVGSVHGIYKGVPKIRQDLIIKIKELTKLPLVLHGGSGIPDIIIRESIKSGINKLNINTDLQIVWSKEVRKYLDENKDVYDPRPIIKSGEAAIKLKVKEKIELLSSMDRA